MRTLLTLLTALLLPFSVEQAIAQIYLSPEDVLINNGGYSIESIPRNPRQAQEQAEMQQQSSAEGRPVFQEYWLRSSSSKSSEAASAAAATNEEDVGTLHQGPGDTPDASGSIDPTLLRLLERLERSRAQGPVLSAADDGTQQSTALHSGAPLSDTGPGDIAVLLVLGGAVAWTLYRGRKARMFS